jgi:mannose-6-phosphate isomerase
MAIQRLKGKVQNYDWGGTQFINQILGLDPDGRPCAEYWMGTHRNGISAIEGREESLAAYIADAPAAVLGSVVARDFDNQLPFLFKVLDVASMLSIQVHPTKEEAVIGFAAEESAGIPLGASHRNFKDSNHKPEIMVALSEFWLLHGFRAVDEIQEILQTVPEFRSILPHYASKQTKVLFQYLMELDQEAVHGILAPLNDRLQRENTQEKSQPDYWARLAFDQYTTIGHFDRGIFSIYLLNLVKMEIGEAIFQGAGIPHAYLQGQNMELMANSDNVFRGGLTPKHVDVAMLMKHTNFDAVVPEILKGEVHGNEIVYKTSCKDFELAKVYVDADENYSLDSSGPTIFFVYQGAGSIEGNAATQNYAKGSSFFIDGQEQLNISATSTTTIFVARMP